MGERDESGEYGISEDVIASIAAIAATEVDGVSALAPGLVGGLSEMLGSRRNSRGVRVEVGTREAAVDVFVLVDYGVRIPALAERVQRQVKSAIEAMTGLSVVEVNVHVQGVSTTVPAPLHTARPLE